MALPCCPSKPSNAIINPRSRQVGEELDQWARGPISQRRQPIAISGVDQAGQSGLLWMTRIFGDTDQMVTWAHRQRGPIGDKDQSAKKLTNRRSGLIGEYVDQPATRTNRPRSGPNGGAGQSTKRKNWLYADPSATWTNRRRGTIGEADQSAKKLTNRRSRSIGPIGGADKSMTQTEW